MPSTHKTHTTSETLAMGKSTKKFYAVAAGRKTGVFASWSECEDQVKKYSGAKYKSFNTQQEAEDFVRRFEIATEGRRPSPSGHVGNASTGGGTKRKQPTKDSEDDGFQSTKKASIATSKRKVVATEWSVSLMFDGGSRGNPGPGGAGAIVTMQWCHDFDDGIEPRRQMSKTIRIRHFLGRCANNEAEYSGLCQGLEAILGEIEAFRNARTSSCNGTGTSLKVHLRVHGDSELIINQVTNVYRCSKPGLRIYLNKVRSLVAAITKLCVLRLEYEHVLRARNSVADGLANQAMDAQRSWITVDGNEGEGA